jgi:hypothetical protein
MLRAEEIASRRSALNQRQNCAAGAQGCAKKHHFNNLERRISQLTAAEIGGLSTGCPTIPMSIPLGYDLAHVALVSFGQTSQLLDKKTTKGET